MTESMSNPANAGPGAPGKDVKGGKERPYIAVGIGPIVLKARKVKIEYPDWFTYYTPNDTEAVFEVQGWVMVRFRNGQFAMHDRTGATVHIEPYEAEEVRP